MEIHGAIYWKIKKAFQELIIHIGLKKNWTKCHIEALETEKKNIYKVILNWNILQNIKETERLLQNRGRKRGHTPKV